MQPHPPTRKDDSAFDPRDIESMSLALENVCEALNIPPDAMPARQIIAVRIVERARRGERSPARLRDRLLKEAKGEAERGERPALS